jgi:hypothetical protein
MRSILFLADICCMQSTRQPKWLWLNPIPRFQVQLDVSGPPPNISLGPHQIQCFPCHSTPLAIFLLQIFVQKMLTRHEFMLCNSQGYGVALS